MLCFSYLGCVGGLLWFYFSVVEMGFLDWEIIAYSVIFIVFKWCFFRRLYFRVIWEFFDYVNVWVCLLFWVVVRV